MYAQKCEGYMKLEVKDITKSFGDKQVLHGISFEVQSGRALGLLGRNGAGKTTTIRILMDVFRANSGEVLLDGEKFNQRKHLIGYLPEERGLYPKKKVIEQMVYLGRIRGISKSEAVANSKKWLKRLGVLEYENAKLETLSKGNQQKVQLASTLVCDPDIVILDEPFSGLDPVLSGDLDNIKREFGKNQLVVSAVDKTLDDLENIINEHMSDILEITGRTKEELIIKNVADVSRKQILSKLVMQMRRRRQNNEKIRSYFSV